MQRQFDIHTQENFLTSDETESIRSKVWELKPYWKNAQAYPANSYEHYKNENPKIWEWVERLSKPLNFLGDATYVIKNDNNGINEEVQTKLEENFSWLYDKVVLYFKEFYETDNVKLHSSLPHPGFHIFNGEPNGKLIFPYHTDKEQFAGDTVEENSIYSFALLIENIEDAAHLEYLPPGKVQSFDGMKNINVGTEGDKLVYEKNNLYIWRGSMVHRIGSLELNNGDEARITFQGHIYFDKNDNFYKVYF